MLYTTSDIHCLQILSEHPFLLRLFEFYLFIKDSNFGQIYLLQNLYLCTHKYILPKASDCLEKLAMSPLRLSLKTPFTKIENKSYHENLVLKHNSWSLGKSQINKNTAYVNKTYIHFVTYIAFFILLHKYTN